MNRDNLVKTYSIIGKSLCAIAGGIIGYVTLGLLFALPALLAGAAIGYFLEKIFINQSLAEA